MTARVSTAHFYERRLQWFVRADGFDMQHVLPLIQFQLSDGHTIERDELHRLWADACEDTSASLSLNLIGNSRPGTANYLYRLHAQASRVNLPLAASRLHKSLRERYPSMELVLQQLA